MDAAAAARDLDTITNTKTKRSVAWQHWNTYLYSIWISSAFLDRMLAFNKNIIISGYAQSIREGTFSKGNHTNLVEGTVSNTLAHVAQDFRANNRKDPRLDNDGKICFIL